MMESTREMVDGAQAPGLSLPLTATEPEEPEPCSTGSGRHSRPVSAANAAKAAKAADTARLAAASAGTALRALPGLDAWSLACRRKTLRGVWRGWLLKSHKSVR